MSVRHSLLAILAQGPRYGYQLRAELERRSGSDWSVNVGQIYNTLDRLERDGLVAKDEADAEGHVYYSATDAGLAAAGLWWTHPLPRARSARDDLAAKLALAATLPHVDAVAAASTERAAAAARLTEIRAGVPDVSGGDVARLIAHEALVAHAEAELAWLDRVSEHLARTPAGDRILPLSDTRPRRGRPARVGAPRRHPGDRAASDA